MAVPAVQLLMKPQLMPQYGLDRPKEWHFTCWEGRLCHAVNACCFMQGHDWLSKIVMFALPMIHLGNRQDITSIVWTAAQTTPSQNAMTIPRESVAQSGVPHPYFQGPACISPAAAYSLVARRQQQMDQHSEDP